MAKGFGRIVAMIGIKLGVAAAFFLLSEAAALAAGSSTGSASSRGAGSPIALPPPPAALPPIASAPDGGIEYFAVPGGIAARVTFAIENGAPSRGPAPPSSNNPSPFQLGVKTWVSGWTVFRNGRCQDAVGGYWVEHIAPQYGRTSSETITYPFPNCNAPMGVLYYTMTRMIPTGQQDHFFDDQWLDANTVGPGYADIYVKPFSPYKQKCNCECPCAGNPFVIATGAKTDTVTDYETSGFNKLGFIRNYNMYPGNWWIGQDSGTPAAVATALGRNWRSNFDRYLNVVSSDALVAERQGENSSVSRGMAAGGPPMATSMSGWCNPARPSR
jgi:hypothetical protein